MLFKRFLSLTVLLLLCTLCACSTYSRSDSAFVGGVTVSPEGLAELSEQLAENATDPETEPPVTVDLGYNGKCYWVSGSDVFHVSDDCRYIRNSKDVKCDNADAAALDGCVRMCSACKKSKS